MNNQSEEREISLSDLLWNILRGWRLIIILAIVFAILLTGIRYAKDTKNISSASQKQNISLEELEKTLSKEEQSTLSQAKKLQKQIEEKETYQKDSTLINIDAYEENLVTIQYYIKADSQYADSLINSYETYINNNGIINEVKNQLDYSIEDSYLGELILAKDSQNNDGVQVSIEESKSTAFSVIIIGQDAQNADELAEAVKTAIQTYSAKLSNTIGSHDLVLVDQYASIISDETLIEKQSDLQTSINTLRTQLTTLTDGFSDTQKQLLEDEQEEENSTTPSVEKANFSKKYFLLGAFVGIFLACVWITLTYILSKKIKTPEEIRELYAIRIFGNLRSKDHKKHTTGIDCWIDSIHYKEQWTLEEQEEQIVANLSVTCKKENIQKIFLTTSLHLPEEDKEQLYALILKLEENGVEVVFGENIIRNVKAFEQMAEIGKIVIVEKTQMTQYQTLEKELILCKEQNADILGCIVIE